MRIRGSTSAGQVQGSATTTTYIFPPFSRDEGLRRSRGYFCNNVAFRRDFLLRHPIPDGFPVYRGNCVVHARGLRRSGHAIWRQHGARATHAPPDGPMEFLWRFLLLGDGAPALAGLADDPTLTRRRGMRHLPRSATALRVAAGKSLGSLLRAPSILALRRQGIVADREKRPIGKLELRHRHARLD